MIRLLQIIIMFLYAQLLIAEENHTKLVSPALNLKEAQSLKGSNVSTTLRTSVGKVKLPYGITLDKRSHEYEDLSHNEKYTLSQNGKVVDVIEGYYVYDIFDGDMDKDGVRELIFNTYSGGAHCCFDLYIAQITKEMKKPIRIPLNNLDTIEFKDLDGDGIQEWIMYDDRYSYFLTCFACSPAVQLVATYKKGKLILRPKLTKIHTAERLEKLTSSHVMLDGRGYLHISQEYAPAVINRFLYHFYSGDVNEGLRVINKYLTFEGRGVKLLFLKEIMERMSESYFWDQLRKINAFYELGGREASIELFDAERVALKLFETMETIERKQAAKVWIDPSNEICQKHGGAYDAKHEVCDIPSDKLELVCQDVAGRVPTLDDFEGLVKRCGSELRSFDASHSMEKTVKRSKANQAYQTCYQEYGFKPGFGYWTATGHSATDPRLIYVNLEEGSFDWYDGWRHVVRCVR